MRELHRGTIGVLALLALAFGWIEGSVVIYLRELYAHDPALSSTLGFPLVSLPPYLVQTEIVREACTLVVLAAAAWLAAGGWAARCGAFLLLFGVWDLAYYAVLRLVTGWPESLQTWDLLFLIPLPWVAPVWAPAAVAVVFVAVGVYLLSTPARPRGYRLIDAAVLILSAVTVVAALMFEWKVVADQQVPERFPAPLFWAGVIFGTAWFVRAEQRPARIVAEAGNTVAGGAGVSAAAVSDVAAALPEPLPESREEPSPPQAEEASAPQGRRSAMVEIGRILCPIDFSDTSRAALEHAIAVARWYESRITALHVPAPAFHFEPPILFAESTRQPPWDTDRAALEVRLRDWLQPAYDAGLQTDLLIADGRPAACILECAASFPADLIVMGTHGRGGFERLILGSVAENVLRKAACPVLTVPPPAPVARALPYTRLLCAVDFSASSLAALRFAFSVAKESDARLALVHVVEWPPEGELLMQRFDSGEFHEAIETEARRRLDTLVTDDVRMWCRPEATIAFGKPYASILETAERDASDLIVIGVHGRNVLDLALFGSTTNQIVRRASCPVLTVRT